MRKISFFTGVTIALLTAALIAPSLAWAEQAAIPGFTQISTNPYIVDDLPISVDADDAVKAREQAFEKALQTGFQVVLERLYPDDLARAQIKMPGTPDLGKMLQDFTTRDEKVGAKQYAATFQLRFRPSRVQKYLQSTGAGPSAPVASTTQNVQHHSASPLPPSTAQAGQSAQLAQTTTTQTVSSYTTPTSGTLPTAAPPVSTGPVIILPFLQTSQGQVLWAGANPLRDAMIAQAAAAQPGPTFVPTGDASDNQMIDEKRGIKSSPQGFQSLMSKYQSTRAVIVIGVPDSLNASAPATKMTLMFYGSSIANPTPVYLDSVVASVDDATQNAALFTRAAQMINAQAPALASRIVMDAPEPELNAQSVSAPVDGLDNVPPSDTSSSVTLSTAASLPHNTLVVSSGAVDDTSAAVAPINEPSQSPTMTAPEPATLTPEKGVLVLVQFNTMTEWNDIRTRLKSIPGITSIQIQKLKAQEATILIPPLAMTSSALNAAMSARGLSLSPNNVMVFDHNGNAASFILTRVSPLPSASSSTPSDLSVSSAPLDQSRTTLDGQ